MKVPKDPRSTGRKRAQAVLKARNVPMVCGARPGGTFAEYSCQRSLSQYETLVLDVNHRNKNILDNDPANLERLCRSCHKKYDSQTSVGESPRGDEFGYE